VNAADKLPRLVVTLAGNRAGVDNEDVCFLRKRDNGTGPFRKLLGYGFGVAVVDFAAQGDDSYPHDTKNP